PPPDRRLKSLLQLNRTLQDSYTCSTVPAFSSVRHAHGKRRAERQTCAHSQGLSIAPLAGVPHSCRSGLPFLSWDVSVLAWQAAAAQSGYVYMLAEHERVTPGTSCGPFELLRNFGRNRM